MAAKDVIEPLLTEDHYLECYTEGVSRRIQLNQSPRLWPKNLPRGPIYDVYHPYYTTKEVTSSEFDAEKILQPGYVDWLKRLGVATAYVELEVTGSFRTNDQGELFTITAEFLSGLVDLSTGLTATPGFTNNFTLAADEVATVENGTVTATTVTSSGSCSDGLEVASDFTFKLVGFVTSYFSATLYSVDVSIADECWTWAT